MSPERRRLHRAGIAVYAVGALREFAVPLLVLFVLSAFGGGMDERAMLRGLAFGVAGLVASTVLGYLRWRTTTWWVTLESVHRKSGLVGTKQTDVPLTRIQSLDLEQGPVQRVFGVSAVHVQTGGGGAKGEIVLEAVGDDEVRELRSLVAGRAPAPVAETDEARWPERELTRDRLLVAALTAGQLGVILPAVAGFFQLVQQSLNEDDAVRLLPHTATAAVALVVALLVGAWLLSVLGSIVAFSGFTVTREGGAQRDIAPDGMARWAGPPGSRGRLRIRRGLLARREATVPVERVRAVAVVEGALRLPFGFASLRMEVIGHAKEAAAAQTLFPLLRRDEVRPFLEELLPELADDLDGLERTPARAARRYAWPPAVLGAVAAAAAWAFTPAGPFVLPAILVGGAYGWLRYRTAGWRLDGDRLAIRSLLVARTTVLGPARYREWHRREQNLLQRRARLADVFVAFGKQTDARVRHLEATTAEGLYDNIGRL
jgi:putative membrane protein